MKEMKVKVKGEGEEKDVDDILKGAKRIAANAPTAKPKALIWKTANIKVDEDMVAKVWNEYEYFNQMIESGVQHYEKTNDPMSREHILNVIRIDRSNKNEFLRALALIGFPGVSNVNGLYEFSEGEAYATVP